MKKFTRKDKRTNLEKEIDSVLETLKYLEPDSDEYTAASENLERLYKSRSYEKDRRVSPDTKWMVAGNLLGIALILWHEKADIITSKALGFVGKWRV